VIEVSVIVDLESQFIRESGCSYVIDTAGPLAVRPRHLDVRFRELVSACEQASLNLGAVDRVTGGVSAEVLRRR
jgi:hypothetical protein